MRPHGPVCRSIGCPCPKIGGKVRLIAADRSIPEAYSKCVSRIRPESHPKTHITPYEWFRGSWFLPILEDSAFGIRNLSDLRIGASVKTIDTYQESNTVEEMVQTAMVFQKLIFPDYSETEAQKLK
jgi:hypothetical protein